MARFAPLKSAQNTWSQGDSYEHGYSFSTEDYAVITEPGLDQRTVELISHHKIEPEWMLQQRVNAFRFFEKKPLPQWGADLTGIDFNAIHYYLRPSDHAFKTWSDVPNDIKQTFERIGVPQAEREVLAGVKMQYDSEVIYGSLKETWEKDGVIFLSMDEGLRQYPDLVKEHFGKIIPSADNKFAALNTAVWSGGSFVYVPPGVKVSMPLQTYFRINAPNAGQFERTLIIVDEGAEVHYIEGCFIAGTSIHTKTGIKNIEDIQCGDQVFTHKLRYKNVYHTQKRPYSGDLFTVSLRGNLNTITATHEHPFLSVKRKSQNERNKSWQTEWIPARKLEKK